MSATGRHQGMTLIEMLVVMAIMGLVTSLAFPRLDRALGHAALQQASADTIATLRAARAQAVRRQQESTVVLLAGDRRLIAADGRSIDMPQGISLAAEGPGFIRFRADGSATQSRFRLSRGSKSVFVSADVITGRVALKQQ